MILRLLFLALVGLVAWSALPYELWLQGVYFAGGAAFFLALEFFVFHKVQFYKVLTFLLTLFLILSVVAIAFSVMNIPVKFKVQIPGGAIALYLLLIAIYAALYYGETAAFFRPANAETVDTNNLFIIDTSALIDGRIFQVCEAGFLTKNLCVPEFVVRELQLIADSTNHEKRKKGRRGLQILNDLKGNDKLSVNILAIDYENLRGVDNKLLQLAKDRKARIITTDFNLIKVAQVEGVEVININQMATLLKPPYAVGEVVKANIVKKGNNRKQGIAYLDDDTMVVVEDGERFIGTTQNVLVTSYIQSETGKMLFCRIA
ncbi:MAG: hypothetical protein JNM63_18210 [Spirochaetia bacterium]|nr:hypothetical protein [Spirochaetia bacterium]